ncbi:similar to Saccharomyces cerevisiae YLR205C HMX1 ER localized heme oxygenase, involved in heme degradation during iron starvation and in the oxidative stress response [Maudiozyma barnettii]|uniref:Similar to Saccharomyces cerevisiae YLR205C HMX1 ER localized heme oxygenase, involved in heme degradation during iron starvation and in the oxidative stress response n=1 Tax=Maudiozyma barnettii TaxID=61262 RepID=A0A8H2VF26_9SACH|nr:Hmx1p [Kazachstania barnettii]CAB4253963.1 similar to Saccharomyces cerevisiae YLR205C HMX1 ER localized heme oxygenase, involved in heme degradation during iron starvation and in the oxidative stress response [Kazachstania barnettii]CAD1781713.1 similar to Saccharomyces cerevisiae YLR205C HMX1 ER localized heme oxygenase, involved in heme degradation during iron starvation and in the oxidative stress response [Kazachstania barnettii]
MSETIPSPTDIGALANRINLHTRDAHNKIDKAMSLNIAFALRHRFIYEDIIKTYYIVFSAIENKIDEIINMAPTSQTATILKSFYVEDFRRKPQLLKDLNILRIDPNYVNNEWLKTRPELNNFVDFINKSTTENPITILAYCHVLYLALFAGGRIIRSSLYKNLGFLPNFDHLTKQEMIEEGTNFFRFAPTTDAENKLRWTYKKNYELNTRQQLTESQKLDIINTASQIFDRNTAALFEIKDVNKDELMHKFSFKLITFLIEEWKFNDTVISQKTKKNILFSIAFIQALLAYFIIKRLVVNYLL